MPALTSDQFEALLRSGKLGSVYLFDGPEEWFKERAVQKIIEKLLPAEARDFNLEKFDGQTSSGGQVASSAQSLPFLADRRVLIVRSAEEFGSADSKVIADTISQLPPTTCLIFLYAGKGNLREEIPAMVSTHGAIVTFWTPFPNQLPKWIMGEMRLRGKSIDFEAAEALAESCSDLQEISNELDKLILFLGKKSSVSLEDVLQHGLPDDSGDQKKFESALYAKDMGEALKQSQLLLEMGVRPEAIFPTMERIFRTMLVARSFLQEKRMSQDDVLKTLRIRGTTQQALFLQGLKSYSQFELGQAVGKIAEADYQIKTGALSGEIALSLLVLSLMQNSKAVA